MVIIVKKKLKTNMGRIFYRVRAIIKSAFKSFQFLNLGNPNYGLLIRVKNVVGGFVPAICKMLKMVGRVWSAAFKYLR